MPVYNKWLFDKKLHNLLNFFIKYMLKKVQISNTIIPVFYTVAMHVIPTPVNATKNYQRGKKRNVLT